MEAIHIGEVVFSTTPMKTLAAAKMLTAVKETALDIYHLHYAQPCRMT